MKTKIKLTAYSEDNIYWEGFRHCLENMKSAIEASEGDIDFLTWKINDMEQELKQQEELVYE